MEPYAHKPNAPLSADKRLLFERIRHELAYGNQEPPELNDPVLKEEFIQWRGEEAQRVIAARVKWLKEHPE